MRRGMKFISVILIVIIATGVILGIDIKLFGKNAKPRKSDCIIVLGCSIYGTEPSPFLKGRLQHAEKLYREGYARYIIVSGGQGRGEYISEAEAMKSYLIERGIDSEKIIMEDRSVSTYENLKYSKYEMDEKGFADAIIVSNQFHLKRSSYIAKKMGIDASFSGVYLKAHINSERKGFIREIPAFVAVIFKLFLNQLLTK